jgi:hypothetical protein
MINPALSQSTKVHEVHNSNGRERRMTECRSLTPVRLDLLFVWFSNDRWLFLLLVLTFFFFVLLIIVVRVFRR